MTSKSCVAGGVGSYGEAGTSSDRTSSQFLPNLIAGVSIASVIVACGWMVYSLAIAPGLLNSAQLTSSVPPKDEARFAFASSEAAADGFQSRFDAVYAGIRVDMAAVKQVVKKGTSEQVAEAMPDGEAAEEVLRRNYAMLLDPSRSMGAPSSFVVASLPKPERMVIASVTPEKNPQPLMMPPAGAAKDAAPSAEQVPLPQKRPSLIARLTRSNKSGPSREDIQQGIRRANIEVANIKPTMFEKLFGKPQQSGGPMLAYAGPDGGLSISAKNFAADTSPLHDDATALYVITHKAVYMPDGTKLEAHSGLGPKKDDPKNVHVRMHGATPPHVYDLTPREALFHGVAAIRLTPIGGADSIHGRTGLLAHTYMLGPGGDSNGCVSFKDYDAFLEAFRAKKVKRLAIVASL